MGGVPWDISEQLLIQTFKPFGTIKVEWPGKEKQQACQPKGYVYIVFESEKQVRALLQACTHDYGNGGSWFFRISSKRMKFKEVRFYPRPYFYKFTSANFFVKGPSHPMDNQRLKLRKVHISQIGSKQNCFRRGFTWNVDCRRTGYHYERSFRRSYLCW